MKPYTVSLPLKSVGHADTATTILVLIKASLIWLACNDYLPWSVVEALFRLIPQLKEV